MPTTTPCRLIVDPPADGPWNMAVDEALLIAAAETETPVLRFYQWQRPTLSLGYFQCYTDRASHAPSLEAEVVRRLSGGGAILHDQELTYSLILPGAHPLARDTQTLYDNMHQAIVRLLDSYISARNLSWKLTLCEETLARNKKSEPFLCFQRRSQGDVLLSPTEQASDGENHKIVGSAQRRRRGAVLQHGSLLLTRSKMAPELLGLTDLTGHQFSISEVIDSLPLHLSEALHLDVKGTCLSESVQLAAQKIVQQKYASCTWTERR